LPAPERLATLGKHGPRGDGGPDRSAALEAKRRATARRADGNAGDIPADRVTDERDQNAVLRARRRDEVVRVHPGATEEEWLLAGSEHEELGDLVAQALRGDRRGHEDQPEDTQHQSPHGSSETGERQSPGLEEMQ